MNDDEILESDEQDEEERYGREIREFYLREKEGHLITSSACAGDTCVSPNAHRHLRQGFSFRALLLKENRFQIRELVKRQRPKGTLDQYSTSDLNIHLNSYYVHLAGALDNLAWAFKYEFNLFPAVTEVTPGRQVCSLFSDRFQREMERFLPGATARIQMADSWHDDLKNLRDPVAHRIPLCVPPSVITDNKEADQVRELHRKANTLMQAGEFHEGVCVLNEASLVGRFQPIILQLQGSHVHVRMLHEQMAEDANHFCDLALPLLGMFRNREVSSKCADS